MFLKRFLMVSLAFVALNASALASPASDLFVQAANFIRTQYFGSSNVNIESLISRYELLLQTQCFQAKSVCAFEVAEPILERLFLDLEDGHAYYLSAEDVRTEQANRSGQATTPRPILGLRFEFFCEALNGICPEDTAFPTHREQLIRYVVQGSPAEAAGIKVGDRFVGYNGVLFSSFATFEEYRKYRLDLTPKVQAGETLRLQIIRGAKRQRLEISVQGAIINTSETPKLELRSDGLAVLTVRDYQIQGIAQKVHDLLREAQAKGAKGIIFEERSNGGGSVVEMMQTIGAFIPTPDIFQFVPRYSAVQNTRMYGYNQGSAFFRQGNGAWQNAGSIRNPVQNTLPLVVLVDEDCASACEYLATYVQRHKRGQVIGTKTAGVGNSNTARFALANGGAAGIPTLRAFWLDGTSLPATVTPDVLLEHNLWIMFETGQDTLLEQAVALLGGRNQ
jgi:carboxyl-terminal processing protease